VNKFIFKEANEVRVIYRYYPNGGEFSGEIEYSISNKQSKILKKAEDDDTGYFARKAQMKVVEKLSECIDANKLPLKFSQAWY